MTSIVNLWNSRERALTTLQEEYPEVLDVMNDLFLFVGECGNSLFKVDSAFGRVTAITVAKSRNLALGCYSLTLDSLAQESGALVRLLIETLEILKYFRLDPKRAMEATERELPKAGEIARLIGSEHKSLRGYLNDHASHFSLKQQAIRHLLDFRSSETTVVLRMQQSFLLPVVMENLYVLYSIVALIGIEATGCVLAAECEEKVEFATRMEYLRNHGTAVFEEAISRIPK
ncbi:hypothetical protein [Nitrosospira briensis]|uniref:hypothetical protein n=1 Tax=Nitrosospira briensis TaxID=35799 RepID=UPI00116017E7|nr:hypothetical protein [Nitrosospira briensis]